MDLLGCKVVFLGLAPAQGLCAPWTAPRVEHRESRLPVAGGVGPEAQRRRGVDAPVKGAWPLDPQPLRREYGPLPMTDIELFFL